MKSLLKRIHRTEQKRSGRRKGVLSFEWVLLITVLVIGIVGALSAVRDSIIDELGDICGAAVAIDQSYTVTACTCPNPPSNECWRVTAKSFSFTDSVPKCDGQDVPVRKRAEGNPDQGTVQTCKK
ncbi:MAG: hypothetical protein NZ602_11955 [Thermoguttaceae bacterium]|nr:hypothetical protein [Thermoguttaceae bacterium]MDW8038625.1 hypothetical protein [Thermoguttaceae bacterium]